MILRSSRGFYNSRRTKNPYEGVIHTTNHTEKKYGNVLWGTTLKIITTNHTENLN